MQGIKPSGGLKVLCLQRIIFFKFLGRVIYHSIPLPRVNISLEGFLGEPIGHVCDAFYLRKPGKIPYVLVSTCACPRG